MVNRDAGRIPRIIRAFPDGAQKRTLVFLAALAQYMQSCASQTWLGCAPAVPTPPARPLTQQTTRRIGSMLTAPLVAILGGFIIGLCLERIIKLLRQPGITDQ